MPITQPSRSRTRFAIAAVTLVAGLQLSVRGASPAAVGVIHSAAWSPDDSSREGAGEFSVLLQLAQLQRGGAPAGLLGVGASRGVFAPGTERALRFAVLSGVPVVKLAAGGDVAASPEELFVAAGDITETEAKRILAEALARVGASPRAMNPMQPTTSEVEAIRNHVRKIQRHFTLATSTLLARN